MVEEIRPRKSNDREPVLRTLDHAIRLANFPCSYRATIDSLTCFTNASTPWYGPYLRQLLPDRRQQYDRFRSGDREQIMRARQAAEALFTSKQDIAEQPVPSAAQEPKSRKPRVLPILASAPIRQEVADTSMSPESPITPEISIKKPAYLRTLVKYGMPISQVADLYGVPVKTIRAVLRKA
jgi:hypothetical protein